MSQADPGACGPQRRNGVLQRRPVLFDVAQLACTQPFPERLGAVFHETFIDQEVREVRPGRRIAIVAKGLLDRPSTFQRAGHTFHRQFATDFFSAQPASGVQLLNGIEQRPGIDIKAIPQNMNGGTAPRAGQLDAVDQLHVQRSRRCTGFFKAFDGVMVSQRQHPDAVLVSTRNKCRGRERTIGGGTVAVQIDIHRGAFAVIDVCYYAVTSSFWLLL